MSMELKNEQFFDTPWDEVDWFDFTTGIFTFCGFLWIWVFDSLHFETTEILFFSLLCQLSPITLDFETILRFSRKYKINYSATWHRSYRVLYYTEPGINYYTFQVHSLPSLLCSTSKHPRKFDIGTHSTNIFKGSSVHFEYTNINHHQLFLLLLYILLKYPAVLALLLLFSSTGAAQLIPILKRRRLLHTPPSAPQFRSPPSPRRIRRHAHVSLSATESLSTLLLNMLCWVRCASSNLVIRATGECGRQRGGGDNNNVVQLF